MLKHGITKFVPLNDYYFYFVKLFNKYNFLQKTVICPNVFTCYN